MWILATLKSNHSRKCLLPLQKDMKKLGPVAAKKNQDKSCIENQDKDKSMVVTSWFKNKCVLLI